MQKTLVPLAKESLHVAIVDEELPYPLTSGKRIRTLNLIRRLARRHRITYLSHRHADPERAREAAAFFANLGIETVVVDRAAPPKSVLAKGPAFYARLAWNLLSPLPYLVNVNNSPALRHAAEQYAAAHRVDLWQCEWTPYIEILRTLVGAPLLVMAHNVESRIWQRYHETETNSFKRWYIKREWRKLERFERGAFSRATRVVAVSADDAALMRQEFGVSCVDVVDNGVDTTYFKPPAGGRDPRRILFVGSLDWRANLDAVKLLLEQVFPRVLAHEPSARLCVVGSNPPDWITRLAQDGLKNVEIHTNVPDVRPYLGQCGVLAVPLRIGGGSRLKILEALASGLPVVSTKIGAEGLCLQPGRHLILVERVVDMSQALVECIRNPGPALAMADRGRRLVEACYDWNVLADKLEQVWIDCLVTQS